MKLGIMQPYFLPYIGYWQLINAVDCYVIYDDVNYIKGGWINRNKILVNNQPRLITIPLCKSSQNKKINQIEVHKNIVFNNILKTINKFYKKTTYYKSVFPMLREAIEQNESNLAKYLALIIIGVCNYLSINTRIIMSSGIDKDNTLKGQDKVIEICKLLGADQYINAIGGMKLYSKDDFASHGITLSFLKTNDIKYKQYNDSFEPNLSLIDVMMFNSAEDIRAMLQEYTLV